MKFIQEGIEDAVKKARQANADEEMRHRMLAREMYKHDVLSQLHDAREEGRLETRREDVEKLIRLKFNQITKEDEARISKLSMNELDELIERIFTYENYEDFQEHLQHLEKSLKSR